MKSLTTLLNKIKMIVVVIELTDHMFIDFGLVTFLQNYQTKTVIMMMGSLLGQVS